MRFNRDPPHGLARSGPSLSFDLGPSVIIIFRVAFSKLRLSGKPLLHANIHF